MDQRAAQMLDGAAMLPAEQDALDLLTDFWAAYCGLPVMHDADRGEAVPHVHALQQFIGMRVAQRAAPETFPIKRRLVRASHPSQGVPIQYDSEDAASRAACPDCHAPVEVLVDAGVATSATGQAAYRPLDSDVLEAWCVGRPSHYWSAVVVPRR